MPACAHKYNSAMLGDHPLYQTLRELKGNPRITVPFALNTGLFAVGLVLVWLISRPGFLNPSNQPAEPARLLSPTDP